ncbi:PEP-CTERM sorting domain-containing protein [Marinobacter alexandrii]|uniref:PEP-CTERM sorting domain-containing protein n=1 Tax=Marinobacter alexandrii TaxID=2570351 RepID=UPI0020002F65|nr:PEP-CTERM sorting domain-containing protein [Marinobacter alexandrii]MCK2147787.1 PEP-CTERM sorting domain-containing protein [Marinobacter alexandrii]
MKNAIAAQFAGIALISALSVATANAALINVSVSGPGKAAAEAAEAQFFSYLTASATETFEGFTAASDSTGQSPVINTSVGSFEQLVAGDNGSAACNDDGFSCTAGLAVLNAATSPFGGRFPMPDETGNKNWLDSMDSREMKFSIAGMYQAVGFYITDPNDVGGIFDIVLEDQSAVTYNLNDIFTGAQPNGAAYYLGFISDVAIASLAFRSNHDNDGFGIDNVTIGKVPEPGTLALMGLGLMGIGFLRRRAQ